MSQVLSVYVVLNKSLNWFFYNKDCFIEIKSCCSSVCGCVCDDDDGILGKGMQASHDPLVLMIPSLVHLWQPGARRLLGREDKGKREREEWERRRRSCRKSGNYPQLIQLSDVKDNK